MTHTAFAPVRIAAAVLALALLAAGCGGGSPTANVHPIDRIAQSADTLLVGSMVLSTDRGDVRIESSCSGTACSFAADGENAGEASVADLTDAEAEWSAPTETYRGVSLARETRIGELGEWTPGDGEWTPGDIAWAGWLDRSAFFVGYGTLLRVDGAGDLIIPIAASMGEAAGTNPVAVAGSATWSGVMMATDMGAAGSRPREIRGDADIVIPQLANPSVDVAFTNVRGARHGRSAGRHDL